jgi:hypothetical protein
MGKNLTESHKHLGIKEKHFFIVVDILKEVMLSLGIDNETWKEMADILLPYKP